MIHAKIKLSLSVFLCAIMVAVAVPRLTLAHAGHTNSETDSKKIASFQKHCNAQQATIGHKLTTITGHVRRPAETLSGIHQRVQRFVEKNSLTMTNNESLIKTLEAQRVALQNAQLATDQARAGFTCEKDSSKDALATYKEALRIEIMALKKYQASVKDFIIAAKTAQGGAR